ncbi:MAG: DUF5658 family protein [Capsulimonadales bacterium]|nr:DUF5658 family protein [Capsulimonadales bacterium]
MASPRFAVPSTSMRPNSGTVATERRHRFRSLRFGGPLRLRRAGEKEAFLLAVICALDMYTTLWWVIHGDAMEANPLLAWTFRFHPIWFVVVKCLSCLPALYFLTRLAQANRLLTVRMLRAAIVGYIGLYLIHVR